MDPAHTHILHQGFRKVVSTTRGTIDEVAQFDFYELWYGLMKKRVLKNGVVDEHPLIFPNILRHFRETQIRVPIDDTHTQIFIIDFYPTEDGSEPDDEPEVEYVHPFKSPANALHPFTRFELRPALAQGPQRPARGPHGVGDAGPDSRPDAGAPELLRQGHLAHA